jgi:hypothetical protein
VTPGTEMTRADYRRLMQSSSRAAAEVAVPVRARPAAPQPRWSRRRSVLSVFAAFAVLGFAAAYVGPAGVALAEPERVDTVSLFAEAAGEAQLYTVVADVEPAAASFDRDGYAVYVTPSPTPTPEPEPAAEASGSGGGAAAAPRPRYSGGGSPAEWMAAAGIAESDWGYVDYIVNRESSWNPNATNSSSGACGLVQALPCSKVPGNGYDPVDNLRWGNGYAVGRYGSWAAAYDFWTRNHWW